MVQTCQRCSRINPVEAAYCYFDGSLLQGHSGRGTPLKPGSQPFPTHFVFPSGLRCQNFDQLAFACQQNWTAAMELLQQGFLERFLATVGRSDLASAAREAARFPDRNRALDQLLAKLPTEALEAPKLQVSPSSDINLGMLEAGTNRTFPVQIENAGMRLLFGSIVSDCKWLTFGEGAGNTQRLFQCTDTVTLNVHIHGQHLRAGAKQLEGRLVIDSNGGSLTVVVRALVPIKAFALGVLAGAQSPRQIAEKAKASPREAAALFESGAVEKWYKENGWTYPIQGPTASGLGAVQQFFEALGLAKAPRLDISEKEISLRGRPGEVLQHRLVVQTAERRPVYAHARSDQPWLVTGLTQLNGPSATIPLSIGPVPYGAGQVLSGRVTVTGNGNQRFVVPVTVAVAAGMATPAPPPLPEVVEAIVVEEPQRSAPIPVQAIVVSSPRKQEPVIPIAVDGAVYAEPLPQQRSRPRLARRRSDEKGGRRSVAVHLIPAWLLVMVVCGIILKDAIWGKSRSSAPENIGAEQVEGGKGVEVKFEEEVVEGNVAAIPADTTPRIAYMYGPKERVGLRVLGGGFGPDKRLTFDLNGNSNSTVLKIDGMVREFGAFQGVVQQRDVPLGFGPKGEKRHGSRTIWVSNNVEVAQIVEIVPSKEPVEIGGVMKRPLDTCVIRYVITNKDVKGHLVGLRVMVDTMIGGNDGVPFLVPGLPGLMNTMKDFRGAEVPDFVQALEFPNLQNPGTIARMTLKLGGKVETPSRVSLTHWPAFEYAFWEIPMFPLNGDSAVAIYWDEQFLQPNQQRELGYAYGLGTVSASEGGGKLGLTLGGAIEPGKLFTATAYVTDPVAGQTLTLKLSDGLTRVAGNAVEAVPPAGGKGTSVVTWKIRVERAGQLELNIVSNNGAQLKKKLTLVQGAQSGPGRFTLAFEGDVKLKKEFTVKATVTDPPVGQRLTLKLPAKMELVSGEIGQLVPPAVVAGASKEGISVVTWRVLIPAPGTYPVRVESSTDAAVTRTIRISNEKGIFQ
jgi:hypothetical protein